MRRVISARSVCEIVLLIASMTCYSSSTTLASEVLYGVKVVEGTLVVRSLDLTGALVEQPGSLMQPGNERLNAMFQNQDRSINVVRTSTKRDVTHRALIRNIGIPGLITDASGRRVDGLAATDSISSLLILKSGPPIALISHYTDTPPFSLVAFDLRLWNVIALHLPWLDPNARYGHLTQCPDGAIYASSREIEEGVHIIQIELDRSTPREITELQVDGRALRNDVSDLACAPSGRLYALADPNYSGSNSLFAVNLSNGAMTRLQIFDVDRMVFVH